MCLFCRVCGIISIIAPTTRCLPEPDPAHGLQGDGSQITVEPGLIGGEVNRILARHKAKHNHPIQYKIGPDPSSIDSCMVGGMVSNNSSGMCCGVSQNTYHTLKDMRVVFLDGTVLDTKDPKSREAFLEVRRPSADGNLLAACTWPNFQLCTHGILVVSLPGQSHLFSADLCCCINLRSRCLLLVELITASR